MINRHGIYQIPASEYHADPVAVPSLSSGIAGLLLGRSPWHAWRAHPRLNSAWTPREASKEMDFGTIVHRLVLEPDVIGKTSIGHFPDWRTKEARAFRDEARAAGNTPILVDDFTQATLMARAVWRQLDESELGEIIAKGGKTEQTVVWVERENAWCRARPDWLGDVILELKTTECAEPTAFVRQIARMGYDLQAAMQIRGVRAVLNKDLPFIFVGIERDPPYALSLIGMKPAWLAFADERLQEAVERWESCMTEQRWPGYSNRILWSDAPGYVETQWAERQEFDVINFWTGRVR